jgi:hypothetical protein
MSVGKFLAEKLVCDRIGHSWGGWRPVKLTWGMATGVKSERFCKRCDSRETKNAV